MFFNKERGCLIVGMIGGRSVSPDDPEYRRLYLSVTAENIPSCPEASKGILRRLVGRQNYLRWPIDREFELLSPEQLARPEEGYREIARQRAISRIKEAFVAQHRRKRLPGLAKLLEQVGDTLLKPVVLELMAADKQRPPRVVRRPPPFRKIIAAINASLLSELKLSD